MQLMSILLPLQGSSWAVESFPHPQLCRCLFVFWQKPLCLFIAVEALSRSLHVPCVRLARSVMQAGKPAGPGISLAGPRRPAGSFGTLLSVGCSSGQARLRAASFLHETLFRLASVSAPCHKWSKLGGKGTVLSSALLGARALRRGPPSPLILLGRHLRLEQRQGCRDGYGGG